MRQVRHAVHDQVGKVRLLLEMRTVRQQYADQGGLPNLRKEDETSERRDELLQALREMPNGGALLRI